jgi:ribose 5-phosphate isomerase
MKTTCKAIGLILALAMVLPSVTRGQQRQQQERFLVDENGHVVRDLGPDRNGEDFYVTDNGKAVIDLGPDKNGDPFLVTEDGNVIIDLNKDRERGGDR